MKDYLKIFALAFVVITTGCANQKSLVYSANSYAASDVIESKKAVVLPFKDSRINENKNHIAMYMIPLMPFGTADYNVPEGQQQHVVSGLWTNYKPVEDYPKALAVELTNASVFEETYFDFNFANCLGVPHFSIFSGNNNSTILKTYFSNVAFEFSRNANHSTCPFLNSSFRSNKIFKAYSKLTV